jgi:ribosomal-protein-serine acetyltransferase
MSNFLETTTAAPLGEQAQPFLGMGFELENWPGYDFPLACRVIRDTDAKILYPVMKRSAKHLKGYIGWAKYAPSWDFKTVQQFVKDHANDDWPRFHLVFSIGKQVVGFGSLAPVGKSRDVQVALWVALGHQGHGIGSWIVTVLEWYAFHVFGFDNVYYQHDSSNRASGSLPPKLGFEFSHTFDQKEKDGTKETGFWYSWKKEKPADIPPGFIDTGDIEKWSDIHFPWTSMV